MPEQSEKSGRLKKRMYTLLILLAMSVFGAALPAQAAVRLNTTSVTLDQGGKKTLKVKGTSKKVSWSSSNRSVAAVSSKGIVTAKKAGTAKITAKVGSKKYTCKVTVRKVRLSASSAKLGRTEKLKLTLSGTKAKVTWSSSNKKIASVSSSGNVTGKGVGKATITAKAGGKKYTCKVTVLKSRITETSAVLGKDGKLTLKAYGLDGKVSWSSSNKKAATVTSKGVVKAKGAGKTTITAKAGKEKLTCKVTVKNVRLNRTAQIITQGDKITLKVRGAKAKVSWSSSNKKIATVTSKGVVKGIKPGKAVITAKVSGVVMTCKITVAPIPIPYPNPDTEKETEAEPESETEKPVAIRAEFSMKDVTTGKELAGAHLALMDAAGQTVEEWVSADTPFVTEKLTAGKYTLTETAAPRYFEAAASQTIDIAKTEETQRFETVNFPYREVYVTLKDSDGVLLPGASLEVQRTDGTTADTWVSGASAYTAYLAQGDYLLKEVLTPYGYETASDISFTVPPRNKFGDVGTISLEMTNEKVRPGKPSEPEDPDDPDNPTDPNEPGDPNEPDDPGGPTDPEDPGGSDDPQKPDEWPSDWKLEDWEYNLYDSDDYGGTYDEPYYCLAGYSGDDQDVICPSEIDGVPVGGIDEELFAGNTELHSIVLPEHLKLVSTGLFRGCYNLRSVRIPDSVLEIDSEAFKGCASLKTLDLPENLVILGSDAFADSAIEQLEFSKPITDFEPQFSIDYMYKLKSVTISKDDPDYSSADGVIYRKGLNELKGSDWTELAFYPLGKTDKNLDIPDGVNGFYDYTNINQNRYLETITVPESFPFNRALFDQLFNNTGSSLKSIACRDHNIVWYNPINREGDPAEPENVSDWKYTLNGESATLTKFVGDAAEVTVPEEIESHPVTAIGSGLFADNEFVKSVTLPGTITSVPARTFVNCPNLEEAVIQEGVTSLDNNAFVGCVRLRTVTLPDSLESINMGGSGTAEMNGISAFNGTAIETLEIPKSFQTLPVFSGMSKLKSVTVDEENELYKAADGVVYSKNEPYTLIFYPEGKKNISYEIPDEVTAFRKETGIQGAAYGGFHALDNVYLETLTVPEGFDFDETYFDYLFNRPKYHLTTITQKNTGKVWNNPINQPDEYEAPGDGEANEDDWEWEVKDSVNATLTKYKGTGKDVVVPSTVNDLSTAALASGLFKGNTVIESVTLPDGLNDIPEDCFRDCVNLKSVKLPDTLESVSSGAFAGCGSLKTLDLPYSLRFIEEDSVSGTSIKSLHFSEYLESMPVFVNVPKLESVGIDPKNPTLYAEDGVVYVRSAAADEPVRTFTPAVIYYPEGKKDSNFDVRSEIETFDYSSRIQYNPYLETITVSESFTFDEALFNSLFNYAERTGKAACRLKSITMRGHDKVKWINPANADGTEEPSETVSEWKYDTRGEGIILQKYIGNSEEVVCPAELTSLPVKEIASGLFSNNSYVKNVTLPAGITAVPENTFNTCPNLETVTIPEGVTAISAGAFNTCYNLKTVSLPDTLTEFGVPAEANASNVFEMTSIEELAIPKGVTTPPVFSKMYLLKNITVDDENEHFKADNGAVFTKDTNTMIFYPEGKTDENFDVPEGITSFSETFDLKNQYLKTMTVPADFTFNEKTFFNLFGKTYLNLETITVRGEEGKVWHNPVNADDAPYVVRKGLLVYSDDEEEILEDPLLTVGDVMSDGLITEEGSEGELIEEVLPEKELAQTESGLEPAPETESESLNEEEIVFEPSPDPETEEEEEITDELPVIESDDELILEEEVTELIV